MFDTKLAPNSVWKMYGTLKREINSLRNTQTIVIASYFESV